MSSHPERRHAIAAALRERPGNSNRAIAQALGVAHATVGSVRREMAADGQLEEPPESRPVASPPEQLRALLNEHRRQGARFDFAWRGALRQVAWPDHNEDRTAWRIAINQTRDDWQAAYESQPSGVGAAITALADARDPALDLDAALSGPGERIAVLS